MEFRYKGIDATGHQVKGVLEAPDRDRAVEILHGRSVTPLEIQEPPEPGTRTDNLSPEPFGVPEKAVLFFTRQLAALLGSGIPMMEALTALRENTTSRGLRSALTAIMADTQRGEDLPESFARHPRIFSEFYLTMLAVGEKTGTLPLTMARLADYQDQQAAMRRKVRGALAYPLFILVFSLVLVYAMVVYLLPGFTPIFQASGLDLHRYPITMALMDFSALFGNRWFLLVGVPVLVGLGWLLARSGRNPRARRVMDRILWRTPGLRGFVQMRVMARVASSFATLMRTGIPMMESIDLVARSSGNAVVEEAIHRVGHRIETGEDLAVCFQEAGVFPSLLLSMISIGQRSGELAAMFERIAEYYESELDEALSTLSSLLEPVMMVGVGGVVFLFVLGIMLPIIGIVQAVQGQG